MNILGIGTLFAGGRGIEAYSRALGTGWQSPSSLVLRDRTIPVYQVDLEHCGNTTILKKLRRSDKLSKMAVLAASDALDDSGLDEQERNHLGLIVATAFGAHVTTFDFLDGILEYGEAAVSPTVFSNSVHNAAASYISSSLAIQGPTLTTTQFFFSFQAALQLAGAWLREGRVKHVLVGAVDQVGEVMAYASGARLTIASDGRIRPFAFGHAGAVPGEGAAFFVVSATGADRAYCAIEAVKLPDAEEGADRPGLDILDADGLLPDESAYAASCAPRTPVAAYAPLYGSMMIGSAFSCAAGALMLKQGKLFPAPVPDNAGGVPVLKEHIDSAVEFIRCIRYNCNNDRAVLALKRSSFRTRIS